MSKYSLDLKMEVVQYLIDGKHSYKEAERTYNINHSDAVKWLAAYKHNGSEGLLAKNETYTGDFKVHVVEYMQKTGSSARQTAARFNIPSYSSVCKWERTYLQEGADALYNEHRGRKGYMGKTNSVKRTKLKKEAEEDLISEVQRLRMENEYLKKLNALIQEKEKSAIKIKR